MHNKKGIKGEFRWEIVDKETGLIVQRSPVKRNLILNQGLDFLAVRSFVDNVSYCAIGTGNTAPLLTDTGLTHETTRTNALDTSLTTYASTSLSGNIYSFTRVFKISNISYNVAYGEIGWSYTSTAGNNLFSKSQIINSVGAPASITLPNSTYLRVYYTISITLSPTTLQSGDNNIVGFPSNTGNYQLQLVGLKKLNPDGTTGNWDAGIDCNELYSTVDIFLSRSTNAPAVFGTAVNRSASTNYINDTLTKSYAGNGIMTKTGNFGKLSANDMLLRCMGYGPVGTSTTNSGFVFVFSANATKDNTSLLSIGFIYSVVRL